MSDTTPAAALRLRGGVARVFACLAFAFIVSMFYRGANGVIAPELMRELSIPPGAMGFVTGIFFLAFAATMIPAGMALDRFGPRRTVAGLLLVAVAGALVFAGATGWIGLALGRALLGIGCAAALMGAIVTLSRWIANARLAQAVGLLSALGAVGGLLSTAPLAHVVAEIGWRHAFYGMAGVTLLAAAAVHLGVRDTPEGGLPASTGESLREVLAGVREVIRHPSVPGLVALQLVAYPAVVTVTGLWGGPFLNDVFGLGAVARGDILLLMMGLGAAGSLVIGSLDRVFGTRKGVILGCGLVSLAGLVPLAAFGTLSLGAATVFLAILGATTGYISVIHTHVRSLFPDRLAGRGLSTLNSAVMLGGFLLQTVTGQIIGAFRGADGVAPVLAYQLVFGFIAACLALGLLAYWRKVPDVPPERP